MESYSTLQRNICITLEYLNSFYMLSNATCVGNAQKKMITKQKVPLLQRRQTVNHFYDKVLSIVNASTNY